MNQNNREEERDNAEEERSIIIKVRKEAAGIGSLVERIKKNERTKIKTPNISLFSLKPRRASESIIENKRSEEKN